MDVRGEVFDPWLFSATGRLQKPETFKVIPDVEVKTTYVWRRPRSEEQSNLQTIGEFDPGSGRTLAACLTHASQGGPAMGNRRTGA